GTEGTHNILLYLALHVGIPGMLLFLWLVARIVRTTFEGFRAATVPFARAVLLGTGVSVLGLGIRLMFDQMFVGVLAVLFWVLVALAMLECQTTARRVSAFA